MLFDYYIEKADNKALGALARISPESSINSLLKDLSQKSVIGGSAASVMPFGSCSETHFDFQPQGKPDTASRRPMDSGDLGTAINTISETLKRSEAVSAIKSGKIDKQTEQLFRDSKDPDQLAKAINEQLKTDGSNFSVDVVRSHTIVNGENGGRYTSMDLQLKEKVIENGVEKEKVRESKRVLDEWAERQKLPVQPKNKIWSVDPSESELQRKPGGHRGGSDRPGRESRPQAPLEPPY